MLKLIRIGDERGIAWKKQLVFFGLIFVSMILLFVPGVVLHESVHWVVASISPWGRPIQMSLFSKEDLINGSLGHVRVR